MQQISEIGVYIDSGVEIEDGVIIEANCSILSKDLTNGAYLKTCIKAGTQQPNLLISESVLFHR